MEQPISHMVYVVDDDDAVRDSMRALLESLGMAVQDYPSARDFLANLALLSHGCLVLDLHMPGMSGVELLDVLQTRNTSLPVIAMTGRGDPALKERVLRAGALALLDKPVEEAKLMAELDRAFALS